MEMVGEQATKCEDKKDPDFLKNAKFKWKKSILMWFLMMSI